MRNNEIEEKLKELKIEDNIWILYIGIIFLSWYSNSLERKYYVFNDLNSKEEYRKLNILIFSILLIVYIYFLSNSYKSITKLTPNTDNKTKDLVYLSFIASVLLVISGFIFLYIAIVDEELDIELAFN